jgi:AcrR family transcriptional regulator
MAEERRDRIIESARALFVRSGYRHTSVNVIAEESGIAKRTLYMYFPSKEAIFLAMLDKCREAAMVRVAAAEESDQSLESKIADLLYAYYGTALEWFGDERHLNELRALHVQFPQTFSYGRPEGEVTARVAAMIEADFTRRGEPADAAGIATASRVLIAATIGIKAGGTVKPEDYRKDLRDIAHCVYAGLTALSNEPLAVDAAEH